MRTSYIAALAYELISQLSATSSNFGVVHCIKLTPWKITALLRLAHASRGFAEEELGWRTGLMEKEILPERAWPVEPEECLVLRLSLAKLNNT